MFLTGPTLTEGPSALSQYSIMIGYTLIIPTIQVLFGLFYCGNCVKLNLNVLDSSAPPAELQSELYLSAKQENRVEQTPEDTVGRPHKRTCKRVNLAAKLKTGAEPVGRRARKHGRV